MVLLAFGLLGQGRAAAVPGLPDGRVYEQASPTNKNGNDAMGEVPTVKASASGDGITFASTFGIPGGKGAQAFPIYLASRGGSSWSTEGLLPPPSVGERAQVIGWSPDHTEVFSSVSRLEAQRVSALVVQSTGDGEPMEITPYTPNASYFYAGQSEDGSVVIFESNSKLVPEGLEGFSNLYAWDRKTGKLSLAGIFNDETSPLKGALAGPYDWAKGINAQSLRLGGALRGYYLRDENAVSPDGSVYFSEVGSGQLYRRLNPTQPQSAIDAGQCTEPAKACTIHVSASHKTNGQGSGGTDSAGPQPAAFQASTADGGEVFFVSPEKLTNDAYTGPEQPPAQIEQDDLAGGTIENPDFIPQRAIGVAVDSEHIYWADPATGAIGRADLNGTSIEPAFIDPGSVVCEVPGSNPVAFEKVASRPRYLTVDSEHIYWTNTGCSDQFGPLGGKGTIGRAKISGEEASIEPAFIEGASNPQGIAVNSEHIYWANAGRFAGVRAIGRATTGGGEVIQEFSKKFDDTVPSGVALSATQVYFSVNSENNNFSYILSTTLEGEEAGAIFVGAVGLRGVSVDGSHIYWATQTQGEEAIGRADLKLESPENAFIPLEGKPNGLAVDSEHLYWASNGETPTNPGNDLYRYGPSPNQLEDLTPDSTAPNGADVQGVLGVSADGKYVYFAANGDLDEAGPAKAGNCKGTLGSSSGSCSLYLSHDGAISLVAGLDVGGSEDSDALNWAGTPRGQFGTNYVPKTSFLSGDGRTLLFRSQKKLTAFDNKGVPELYRFRVGEGISCVSCNPAGEVPGEGPKMGRLIFPGLGMSNLVLSVSSRILSASGDRAFFETSEALVPEDTNGQDGCPLSGTGVQFFPSCADVYEWEAAGTGSCEGGSASFSPVNKGCVYLISTGKSEFPSLFADASSSGADVFFFTREALVGQDKDELQDVYDARIDGGLPSQNPVQAIPCESAEACHPPGPAAPAEPGPGTATFFGPGDPAPKHKKQKAKKHRKKHKGKSKTKGKRANAKGRVAR